MNGTIFLLNYFQNMKYIIALCLLTFFSGQPLFAQCDDCYETPFLGVYSNGISRNKAKKLKFENSEGSYVTGIIGNTAAEKAGLQPFDYIFGIDEYRTDYGRSLTYILKKYDPRDEVTIHYYRNGQKQQQKVRLGKRSEAEYNKRNKREDPFLGVEQSSRNWDESTFGIRVNIVDNSTAESIGLEDGDLITHINGFPILDWTDMGTAIDMMEVGNQMKVTFERKGQTRNNSGTIKSLADTKYNSSYSNNKSEDWSKKNSEPNASYHYDSDDGKNRRVEVWTNTGRADKDYDVPESRNVAGMKVRIDDLSNSIIEQLNEQHDLSISTSNNLTVNDLELIPNTKKGQFDLKFELGSKGNTVVDIYNEKGRNIYNYDLGTFSGDFEDSVDLAQNGTGAYYLIVRQSDKSMGKILNLNKG